MKYPRWLKTVSLSAAILVAGILIGGILAVPIRSASAPNRDMQPRLHWNTKNTTRFSGQTLAETSILVSRAAYPATIPDNSPDVIFLYDPDHWQAGIAAAALLRPLNGVLLPAVPGVEAEIQRLAPRGSQALAGERLFLLNGAMLEGFQARTLSDADLQKLRLELSPAPQNAILINPDDPATALLTAPWIAYHMDLPVFDSKDLPSGLPVYSLGNWAVPGVTQIPGRTPEQVAVNFATYNHPGHPGFGWGMDGSSLTGYRAYTLALKDDPATALLSANLAIHGKPGPLLWAGDKELPQITNNYLWSQRAAFWVTPAEGPFHHFWILGDTSQISFPAQSQADYAVEIGPYLGKGPGMSGIDMLSAIWVSLGLASAAWILAHEFKFLTFQNWIMRLAWPLLALMLGLFGIIFYYLAYNRPVIRYGEMMMWDRPVWMQGMVATVSAVGFGASLMIASGYIITLIGIPLFPSQGPLFFVGGPMIVIMIINYLVAVLISWLLFQTPMMAMFHGKPYRETLGRALPMVLVSMTAAALGMNPGMWWLMMDKLPMMPTEESILWFGVMFFSAFLAFLIAWPLNYALVRLNHKSGLM